MSNAAKEVVVVSGVRTAIGDFGGSLKDFSPTELGAKVVREVLSLFSTVNFPLPQFQTEITIRKKR